jgi:hypothetical protein
MGSLDKQTSLLSELNDTFCQQQCFAYAKCGGGYATAPCQCAWRNTSSRYLQCKSCPIICLRRIVAVKGQPVDDARQHYKDGLDLFDLKISQGLEESFPLFIPLRTADFPKGGGALPLSWAASDATQVKERLLTGPVTNPRFINSEGVRSFLRVTDECRLMAVMNAQDKVLERFWKLSDRIGRFQQLASYGFELSTGATFSVTELTEENTPMPRFHNLVMQRRHNRVLSEIQRAGLTSVPNLYWLDNREERWWVEWLQQNPLVRYVSRDFTRTRHKAAVQEKLAALLNLLDKTGRPFHVFLVGLGPAIAASALQHLAKAGHTGTVLTSDPIMQGIHGKLYDQELKPQSTKSMLKYELVLTNIELFETGLLEAIDSLATPWKASRNSILPTS